MESHILNMYHQQRFPIGHNILRSTSESPSSEGSCPQNTPEYVQDPQTGQYLGQSTERQYWEPKENQSQLWEGLNNENSVIEQSSQDTSSDEEDNDVNVGDVSLDTSVFNVNNIDQLDYENLDNESLEGDHDYDIIQVYAVHPDFDLEASSEEDEQNEYCLRNQTNQSEDNYSQEQSLNNNEACNINETSAICHDSLGINLDTPVVSNVNEYFNEDPQENDILAVKDTPVVNDVDEYFIKESKSEPQKEENKEIPLNIPNVDDFFIKNEISPASSGFTIPKHPISSDIFDFSQSVPEEEQLTETLKKAPCSADVSISDSDLDVLPNIEEIKKYLLEDVPHMKLLHNEQKSCSAPHSPMHFICTNLGAKTCSSFEDLNLELSDLNFDYDKDKSANSSKSDDISRILTDEDVNSFLIINKTPSTNVLKEENGLKPQVTNIEGEIGTETEDVFPTELDRCYSSTPIPRQTVSEFSKEKSAAKEEADAKAELDDFVDVESCNEPVAASNVNSLLKKIEVTGNFNLKPKKPVIDINAQNIKNCGTLTNGMRLQDASMQLNKNKMLQIMMPSTVNTAIKHSSSPVNSDHNYCSPKKRCSISNLKRGQSLLKPEVLASNSRILNSRHRSCKNKKIVYNLSSDDEDEKFNSMKIKKVGPIQCPNEDKLVKTKKSLLKEPLKVTVPFSTVAHGKKESPVHSVMNDVCFGRSNSSVMVNNACKASDNPSSQSYNRSIKLTIKNKSKVIITNCDDIKDHKKEKKSKKHKTHSVSEKSTNSVKPNLDKSIDNINNNQNKTKTVNNNTTISVKEKLDKKPEHFYTALFNNTQDVQVPHIVDVKSPKQSQEDCSKSSKDIIEKVEVETKQPQKKKKLNLQEYKLRRGVSSCSSSATVSPESIFPDMPVPDSIKIPKTVQLQTNLNESVDVTEKLDPEKSSIVPKKLYDPIKEASRIFLMNAKKQKAEAMRKRDEEIVMSKIPKVENLELQPLISDEEMMKIVSMGSAAEIIPLPIIPQKPHNVLCDYDELVLLSIGTNTEEEMFESQTLSAVTKSTVNFKIKKPNHILKHNVFDVVQKDSQNKEEKLPDLKIDKDRFKDITATLKSVEKKVDIKISSNSLFSSIQDTVMKKAPEVIVPNSVSVKHRSKSTLPEKESINIFSKTIIVRKYDDQTEHGEDKIILHLEKNRIKPEVTSIGTQTDLFPTTINKRVCLTPEKVKPEVLLTNRVRTSSDMSMSSGSSPDQADKYVKTVKTEENIKLGNCEWINKDTKAKRSNSRDGYKTKCKRSSSSTREHSMKRSPSLDRSRSRSRYRRYRRCESPYRRKRRSRTRSPHRKRFTSPLRKYRNRSRSRSEHAESVKKKIPSKRKPSPLHESTTVNKKAAVSKTLPLTRRPTVSESSGTSSSSVSSSSSSISRESMTSRQSSNNTYRQIGAAFKKENYRRYNSWQKRDRIKPMEERRIVFVGKLENDISKQKLWTKFLKFGHITEVRLHTKKDGSRYGFITYSKSNDAWAAVGAASSFPQYDIGFGGRRIFCRQKYSDLDADAKYMESTFHDKPPLPVCHSEDMSFEQMLSDVKMKLNQIKGDKKRHVDSAT